MPSKKKKYNARFPPARIKKIMQSDEEVGKVAQAVPVIISRALELFVESLLKKAEVITLARNAKTLTPSHLKQCILAEQRFDFLKDIVENIPDVQGDEDCATPSVETPRSSTSNSPFVFPAPSRQNSSGSSFSSSSTSTFTTSVQSPIISEPPPVIVSSGSPAIGFRPQMHLPQVSDTFHYQQQYDSLVQSHTSSIQNSFGVNSNPYIPAHLSHEPPFSQHFQQQQHRPSGLNLPILSHYEYLPNNLHFTPSSGPNNNNGLNFSPMHQQQIHNNGPEDSVSSESNLQRQHSQSE